MESSRLRSVQSPMIPIVGQLVREYPGTISLGQGVVHFGPPAEAAESVSRFLADPSAHLYKAVEGIPELASAFEQKLAAENGIHVRPQSRVVVTAGGNMAFMNAVLAVADPGDEIILLSPYYFNHEMAITMAGCKPVIVRTNERFHPDLDAIAGALTPRTRAVTTISPNNPTGAVYPRETLIAINRLCRERGIYHISDEAYEYFVYGDARHFSPGAIAGAAGHTISLFSLSKAFGMASWRIGFMVVPEELMSATRKIQDTILICPPVVSQWAGVGALAVGRAHCDRHLAGIGQVREILLNELDAVRGLCTPAPADGAFYVLLRVHTKMNDLELVKRLIREHGVAVLPGSTFGLAEGCHLRVAYAALKRDTAAEAISRLVKGLGGMV